MNSTPPPPYPNDSESELGEILGLLDTLTLEEGPTSSEPPTLYHYQSPTQSGYTSHWDVAAEATQGVPGASPRRLNKNKQSRGRRGGYAVFAGLKIGAFRSWEDARPHVDGVPGNIYQGYASFEAAAAAFDYARARKWTRECGTDSRVLSSAPAAAVPELPTPVGLSDAPNPLHSGHSSTSQAVWYIVYSGITPGVYQSSLESSLNTVGLPGAVHESCTSRVEANIIRRTARVVPVE
ncbi:hypothetical protein B0H11DRAFT_2218263 [Mycena galericulata]|nr:hypothetical protein B0H11DRAFT_2218263 [Mycena galericulata]